MYELHVVTHNCHIRYNVHVIVQDILFYATVKRLLLQTTTGGKQMPLTVMPSLVSWHSMCYTTHIIIDMYILMNAHVHV